MLGFGCASLLGSAGRKQSLRALETAYDCGVNFFDTARSYGFGQSEGLLGEFLTKRRQTVVICTKFGILPDMNGWKQRLKPIARAALRMVPGLRGAMRRRAGTSLAGGHFNMQALHDSLHTSLRELRTDYVDMLLMHAAPRTVLAQDDLLAALERLVEAGKVRVAGLSGELDVIAEGLVRRRPVLETLQFGMPPQSLRFVTQTPRHADLLLVANHPFGGAAGVHIVKKRMQALTTDERLLPSLRAELSSGDPQLLPEVVLNGILEQTGIAAVVSTMLQPEHIRANVAALERCRFSGAELTLLRETFAAANA